MKWLSEKLTDYVINTGAVSKELYAVYQYGFQIGLEMMSCLAVCLIISIYLHIIPEFIIFSTIFMLLRSYAGGLHLNSFCVCFICSIAVQTIACFICTKYQFQIMTAWIIITMSSILIYRLSPVDSITRELDKDEKKHCKNVTLKVLIGILFFAGCCTFFGRVYKILTLIAITNLIVVISQCFGVIKFKIYKRYMHI